MRTTVSYVSGAGAMARSALGRGVARLFRGAPAGRLAMLLLVVSILAAPAAIVSCSPAATPTATPAPTARPTPSPLATRYPVTVTDLLGRSVQVNARPTRIVTLQPTATETLYRVGGTAVGRDTSSKYPPEAQALPTVGGAYSPSMEVLANLQPDLIIIEGLTQARLVDALQKLGAPILVVRATSLDDVARSLTLVGQVVDRTEAATRAVAEIKARVDAAKGQVAGTKKVLILISDAERNIYAAKPESYPGAVAALLNLTNLAAGLPDSGPYPGFTRFSGEQALTANPDAVFTISPAPPPAPTLSSSLPRVPGYSGLEAVKAGRVKEVSPELFLQASGPRIAEAVEELARLVREAN